MFRNTKNLKERERIKDNLVLKNINAIFRNRSNSKEKISMRDAKFYFNSEFMKVRLIYYFRISMGSINQLSIRSARVYYPNDWLPSIWQIKRNKGRLQITRQRDLMDKVISASKSTSLRTQFSLTT